MAIVSLSSDVGMSYCGDEDRQSVCVRLEVLDLPQLDAVMTRDQDVAAN